ncbi:MAG: hypothetical protein RL549_1119, partial [Verrucomicrobiota bacterium]
MAGQRKAEGVDGRKTRCSGERVGIYRILQDQLEIHTTRGVAKEVMGRSLGGWTPGHSRRNPMVQVRMISNVSRVFVPARRSFSYRGGNWVRRVGRRVGSWVGAGIK